MRRIAHLDMDAFYASVELLRYPELRGYPLVIGGRQDQAPERLPDGSLRVARLRHYSGRGVITTATYEARALGVHSGMGVMKAAQLAPDALLLPVDFDAYRHYSRRFKAAVRNIAPLLEDRGIDEIYLDLSTHAEDSLTLATQLKNAVFEATGLTCSIGITPNKLLAKLCSDLNKPNGITLLNADEIESRIWPLALRKINGIGPKAEARLAALGLNTIGELAAFSRTAPEQLQTHFGLRYAQWLERAAHGQDDSPVRTSSEPKSLSRENTFERDYHPQHDSSALNNHFSQLCQRLAEDLQRKGYAAQTIGLKLRFDDFSQVSREQRLPQPTQDARTIRRTAAECLRRIELKGKVRLLGIKASTLTPFVSEAPRQGQLAW